MCEVTRDNFESLLPDICQLIDTSAFLSFDCEFTALEPDPDSRLQKSLFDDVNQRYRKLSQPSVHSIISQLGVSIFQQEPATNTFTVRTFNLYVAPRSLASVDETFACSTSSLEFLMRYNFDFNKFLYRGVPYLNHHTESQLRADLSRGILLESGERNLPIQDEDWIRQICCQLSQWIHTRLVQTFHDNNFCYFVPSVKSETSRRWTSGRCWPTLSTWRSGPSSLLSGHFLLARRSWCEWSRLSRGGGWRRRSQRRSWRRR